MPRGRKPRNPETWCAERRAMLGSALLDLYTDLSIPGNDGEVRLEKDDPLALTVRDEILDRLTRSPLPRVRYGGGKTPSIRTLRWRSRCRPGCDHAWWAGRVHALPWTTAVTLTAPDEEAFFEMFDPWWSGA